VITREEMMAALSSNTVQQPLASRSRQQAAQRSPGGTHLLGDSASEAIWALEGSPLGRKLSQEDVDLAFHQMDLDKDGVISQAEFVAAFCSASTAKARGTTGSRSPPQQSYGSVNYRDEYSAAGQVANELDSELDSFQARLAEALQKVGTPRGQLSRSAHKRISRTKASGRQRNSRHANITTASKAQRIAAAMCSLLNSESLSKRMVETYLIGTPYEDFGTWLLSQNYFAQFASHTGVMGREGIEAAACTYLEDILRIPLVL